MAVPAGVIDVLGICTDGRSRWVRPATVRRAYRKLANKKSMQTPELLDTICAYSGYGIVMPTYSNFGPPFF